MTVNISCSLARAWGIMSVRGSIIADHGHNNASIASLVNHILKVVGIRELFATAAICVFVFWLIEDDWPTIRDLRFGNGSTNCGDVAIKQCQ